MRLYEFNDYFLSEQQDPYYFHTQALDIIEKLYHETNIPAMLGCVEQLIEVLKIIDANEDTKQHSKIEVIKASLISFIKQFSNSGHHTEKTVEDPGKALRVLLQKIYADIIDKNKDFEQLATSNQEAKDKIKRLANYLASKASDNSLKKAASLIYKQATVIS
jgi:hypothetical protein